MPIFEYQCQTCGHCVEILEKSASAPKPVCPQCQGLSVKKLLSGFSVGSGRPDTPACETCPGASGGSSPCRGGQCPLS